MKGIISGKIMSLQLVGTDISSELVISSIIVKCCHCLLRPVTVDNETMSLLTVIIDFCECDFVAVSNSNIHEI